METISCAVKRKRRKTRKCLDEIRKRSRRNACDSVTKSSPKVSKVNKAVNMVNMKSNVCITSDRLTLAMFPKVIRSETVTRPILPEIEKDSMINFDIISSTKCFEDNNPEEDRFVTIPQSNSDSDFIKNSEEDCISSTWDRYSGIGQMSLHKDSDSGNLSTQDNSPGSLLLFSPANQTGDSDLFEVSPNETLSSTTSPASPHARGTYGDHLYAEFLNEIPMYLKQYAPALIRDDVMKKTKALLHNIYMESCRQECEDNILNCMRSGVLVKQPSPRESLVHSPIEFLPVSHLEQMQARRSVAHSILHETPDYTYYPHKLYQ